MNPFPVAVVMVFAFANVEAVIAIGLSVAVLTNGAAVAPHLLNIGVAGAAQKMSVHVRSALLLSGSPVTAAKDAAVSRPHDARILSLNGTVTWCVASCTESIAPPAPQYTSKSAARATPDVIDSMSRSGLLLTVEYPCTWNSPVRSANDPALRDRSASTQLPTDGVHTLELGLGVFSFGAPCPQRGPFSDDPSGSPLACPRPQPVMRQVPGIVTPPLPLIWNVESPPNTVALLCTANSAGNPTVPEVLTEL